MQKNVVDLTLPLEEKRAWDHNQNVKGTRREK